MVLLREHEPVRSPSAGRPSRDVPRRASAASAARPPAAVASPPGAAAGRDDALGGVLHRAVLQRWPLALPPVKRGVVTPWSVDTHGKGGEFIKGWIDNAVETYNRGALLALIKQLGPSSDEYDAYLVEYARAALRRTKPWAVFGLGGRTKLEIETAVRLGYRRFDCAESYGNTALLADAVKACGLHRDSYEVLYKFDLQPREDDKALVSRLTPVCARFGGRVDSLVIHNLDVDWNQIAAGWTVLAQLKRRGLARRIGIGNVRARHGALLELLAKIARVDVIENTLDSVLLDDNVRALVAESGAQLFAYNVMTVANAIGLSSAADLTELIGTLDATPSIILSSSQSDRNAQNLADFATNPFLVPIDTDAEEDLTTGYKIFEWRQQQSKLCATNEEIKLPKPLLAFLTSLLDDRAASARNAFQSEGGEHSRTAIVTWLRTRHGIEPAELVNIVVPRRSGLRQRFAGMALVDVLLALLGTRNCDWKWSIELVQLLLASVEDWESFLRAVAEEIADS